MCVDRWFLGFDDSEYLVCCVSMSVCVSVCGLMVSRFWVLRVCMMSECVCVCVYMYKLYCENRQLLWILYNWGKPE